MVRAGRGPCSRGGVPTNVALAAPGDHFHDDDRRRSDGQVVTTGCGNGFEAPLTAPEPPAGTSLVCCCAVSARKRGSRRRVPGSLTLRDWTTNLRPEPEFGPHFAIKKHESMSVRVSVDIEVSRCRRCLSGCGSANSEVCPGVPSRSRWSTSSSRPPTTWSLW